MSDGATAADRTLLVDAGVLVTLADVGSLDLLAGIKGPPVVPWAVAAEVRDEPARRALATAVRDDWIRIERADHVAGDRLADAATHLGVGDPGAGFPGDVALLAFAMSSENAVVVSDDKPLRQTCKALSVPVSGSIGVLVRSVELRGARSRAGEDDTARHGPGRCSVECHSASASGTDLRRRRSSVRRRWGPVPDVTTTRRWVRRDVLRAQWKTVKTVSAVRPIRACLRTSESR